MLRDREVVEVSDLSRVETLKRDSGGLFSEFLNELAPYVVVCGSFARRTETEDSDIDCFLRSRPRQEVDLEAEENNEAYMPEVLALIQKYGFYSDSVCVGHIAVERQHAVPRMVEVSCHYRIPHSEELFVREIYGVPMLCASDEKDAPWEECYDQSDWDDEVNDVAIRFPLPVYEEAVKAL